MLRRVAALVGSAWPAVGLALSLGSSIGGLLVGVQPDDPATFVCCRYALSA